RFLFQDPKTATGKTVPVWYYRPKGFTPDTPIREAQAIMTEQRCRHLPVVRERKVVGLVSIGDCNRWVSRDQEFTIRHMAAYIQGDYPG
ncbi:MAG: CBS domain-containing protein, partial [Acidobacteriota bacterium]